MMLLEKGKTKKGTWYDPILFNETPIDMLHLKNMMNKSKAHWVMKNIQRVGNIMDSTFKRIIVSCIVNGHLMLSLLV